MEEKYRPKTVSEKLGKLIEECGELQAALGKTLRFGWLSSNPEPDTPDTTNREWVLAEMEDVEQAIQILRVEISRREGARLQ